MSADIRSGRGPGAGRPAQLFGFGGGMVFYALHLLSASSLVPLSCEIGSTWPVHVATVIAVAGIAASAMVALTVWRVGRSPHGDEGLALRQRMLGQSGLLLNGLALMIVVFSDLPNHFLSPCLP